MASIQQDLTYLLVGLKKKKKEADDFIAIGRKNEHRILITINTKLSAAYKMAISGIENILKKDERRRSRGKAAIVKNRVCRPKKQLTKKEVNKYGWL